jgi:hypothetical protein
LKSRVASGAEISQVGYVTNNEQQTGDNKMTTTATRTTARYSTRDADRADRLATYMAASVAAESARVGNATQDHTGGVVTVAPTDVELSSALENALEAAAMVAMVAFDDSDLAPKKVQSTKGRSLAAAIAGAPVTTEETLAIEAADMVEITYAPEVAKEDCTACARLVKYSTACKVHSR